MSEADAVKRSLQPVTVQSLVADLQTLGVRPGAVLLVHASLRALGWVCGAQVAVIDALMQALTPAGTLVMPTHSAHFSDPANWQHPPVPEAWWATIRASMPGFDPATTPTRGMGVIPEAFRAMPGVRRSYHPTASFAAWGQRAAEITQFHALRDPLGEESPLGRIYDLAGDILLLGVGHDKNTSLHLAERRAFGETQSQTQTGAPILGPQGWQWVTYAEPDVDSDDFEALGQAYGQVSQALVVGKVGLATALYMPQRELVEFGVAWLKAHRGPSGQVNA
ncbi:SPBc2 prophage-derived aminoglycoside N(3')-acetyltransferase-like protein YokD [Halomicronema hongdechloris C2206]|uniref:Aminoglycoside N(3)-acetyltransferase n=1 Tax=Halomicronema hongdechloris C2206 TaxID=1641165 RepID=A0A1Z3HQX9_9CYAN|nr:AAC(3) family N-acetyltransferase [Halomicronema hongdechloris]ASC72713.1 SPBc2 prophage-derived aminoglycoside N(3')-acetyltransferase-like protein YokD [Halomicronema hongdechloris C2206]